MLDTSAPGQFGTRTLRHPDNSALVFFSLILRTKLSIMEIQYSYSPTVKRLICFNNSYFWFEQSVTSYFLCVKKTFFVYFNHVFWTGGPFWLIWEVIKNMVVVFIRENCIRMVFVYFVFWGLREEFFYPALFILLSS